MDDNRIEECRQEDQVLFDRANNGKVRPWKEKKLGNVAYYEILSLLGSKKAERVSACAEVLRFNVLESGSSNLKQAWFCKSPLCPICNWRKAMKHSYQVMRVATEVVRRKKLSIRWLFLTLTVKNVFDGKELDDSLKTINRAFNRLVKYKKVAKNLVGFVRSTEITVNSENGSYNQHIHVLLCVTQTYFKGSENYINQGEWTDFWQRALKIDYRPIVHIEAVKEKKRVSKKEVEGKLPVGLDTDVKGTGLPDGLESAVKETAKYAVKSSDYLTNDEDENIAIVQDLEEGLYKKRMIGWGGLLKDIHKEMDLASKEEDLIHVDDENDDDVEEVACVVVARWNWYKQNYYLD